MGDTRKDRLPWLLLPGILLTLCGVTLLAPRQAAQAAPSSPLAAPSSPSAAPSSPSAAPAAIEDDGDGDELLEHWGDPKYGREERIQMAGMVGGFLLVGGLAYRRRVRGRARTATLTFEDVTSLRKAA